MRLINLAQGAVKSLTIVVALLGLAACEVNTQVDTPDDSGGEPAEEADADTDADSDADSDTDGDTDTDDEFVDEDGDGVSSDVDCNDNDASIYPGASEECDGVDEDCDGDIDEDADCDEGYDPVDADGDGFAVEDQYGVEVDCDDSDPDVHPGAEEIADDGLDNDCKDGDEVSDTGEDVDNDGWTVEDGDCDDSSEDVYPDAPEDCDDGLDNDCDGDEDHEDSACIPDDLGEGLDWVRVDGDAVGLNFGIVFADDADVVDPELVAVTGNGVEPDWSWDEDNLVDYDSDGFLWYSFSDDVYRVTWLGFDDDDGDESKDSGEDEVWAIYDSLCDASSTESSLCWENSNGTFALCFLVDDGEVQIPDPEDCEALE